MQLKGPVTDQIAVAERARIVAMLREPSGVVLAAIQSSDDTWHKLRALADKIEKEST